MPAATEPAKPTPPTGPEIKLGVAAAGAAGRVNPSVVEAIKAAAAKNAPQEPVPLEPPPEPPPTAATPPAPTAAQPEAVKPAAAPPAPAAPEEPKGIKQVRDALERANMKLKDVEGSLTSTTKEKMDAITKVMELEARFTKQTEELEKNYKPRAAKLEEAERRLVEKEEILRIRDYQSTDEFHNNYVKPIADAYAEATSYMGQLVVGDGNGAMRQATQDDLNEIIGARSLNEAATLAQEKFGPIIAPTIVNMKVRINGLERARQEKVKNAGIDSAKWVEQQQISMAQQRENFRASILAEAEKRIAESQYLAIPEDDEEGKAALNSAKQFADSLWDDNPHQTPAQVTKRLAEVRHDVIEARVLRPKYAKLQEENKLLKQRLSDYEASEPTMSPRGAGAPPASGKPADAGKAAMLEAANALAARRGP